VTVTAPSDCAWTASSSNRWLVITAGGSGNGSGTVSYRVKRNLTRQARTGTMTIAGTAFTVTQASR
jgi:hypothetical protein